jgi:hypothetical protein
VAGTQDVIEWAARTKSRYRALQVSVNRSFKSTWTIKTAYTLSRTRNMTDEDGWVALTWNHPLMWDENFALASYDRTHVLQTGFAWRIPFFGDRRGALAAALGGWQVNGILGAYSGTPFSVPGSNQSLNCQGCGPGVIDVAGAPKPTGRVGLGEAWYDTTLFSPPAGTGKPGFGNSGRNRFRRPPVWNLSMGFFKSFGTGRLRPEIRIEVDNILNRVNWGAAPNFFDYASPVFMRFTPASTRESNRTTGDIPGPRRVRLGVRVAF